MPRCTVCAHPNRPAIDAALIAGGSVRAVAAAAGLDRNAVHRHSRNHLPPAIQAAAAARLAALDAVSAPGPSPTPPEGQTALNAFPEPFATVAGMPGVTPGSPVAPLPPVQAPSGPPPGAAGPARAIQLDPNPPPAPAPVLAAPGGPHEPPPSPDPVSLDPFSMVLELRDTALSILREAQARQDPKTALAAVATAAAVLDRLARLVPRDGTGATAPALAASPEWVTVRGAILAALAPYPDARVAVAEALSTGGALA